jgi:predicted nucleic acid-binding protein
VITVYLDTCSLSRLWDRSEELRVTQETAAVRRIVERAQAGDWVWVASDALERELERAPREPQRREALDLLRQAERFVEADTVDAGRALELVALGLKMGDALHVACAERCAVHALLTVDDRMLRCAARNLSRVHVRVLNPVDYLQEMDGDGESI